MTPLESFTWNDPVAVKGTLLHEDTVLLGNPVEGSWSVVAGTVTEELANVSVKTKLLGNAGAPVVYVKPL